MLASREMRAIRELPIAAPLVLAGAALFLGGGPGDGSIPWLGGGALLACLLLLWLRGASGGALAVAPLYLLAAWCAVSIGWSWLPDASWSYANRTLVYALVATVGLWAAGRTRALALGLAALLGAVLCWTLLGKVIPPVYDYGSIFVNARLKGPIGLWNQVALAADYAIVLALWRRGRSGTLLAYVAVVSLLLTYSRGGILTLVVVGAAWFVLADERMESAATLVAAAVPAAVVVGIAFLLPGITKDHQPLHVRWRDGIVFGLLLLAGAGVSLALERLPRPRDTPRLRRGAIAAGVLVAAAAIAAIAVRGIGSGAVSNSGSRFTSTSSNFRFTWWSQAWRGFEHHVLLGTGAGSFQLLNQLYRKTYLDSTIEPHNLPLQFLAELGIVGLALLVLAVVLLARPSLHRRGHELALALFLPAFLVHALVDVDWDFLAVSVPAFVAAGALAGRPAARRASVFELMPAAGVALLLFAALLLPWLAGRWVNDAYGASAKRSVVLARRAHSVDPLILDPYWQQAEAAATPRDAYAWYLAAIRRQPRNPQSWLAAGLFAERVGCPYQAWTNLEQYVTLDPNARPDEGGDDYNRMLKLVNARKYTC